MTKNVDVLESIYVKELGYIRSVDSNAYKVIATRTIEQNVMSGWVTITEMGKNIKLINPKFIIMIERKV